MVEVPKMMHHLMRADHHLVEDLTPFPVRLLNPRFGINRMESEATINGDVKS